MEASSNNVQLNYGIFSFDGDKIPYKRTGDGKISFIRSEINSSEIVSMVKKLAKNNAFIITFSGIVFSADENDRVQFLNLNDENVEGELTIENLNCSKFFIDVKNANSVFALSEKSNKIFYLQLMGNNVQYRELPYAKGMKIVDICSSNKYLMIRTKSSVRLYERTQFFDNYLWAIDVDKDDTKYCIDDDTLYIFEADSKLILKPIETPFFEGFTVQGCQNIWASESIVALCNDKSVYIGSKRVNLSEILKERNPEFVCSLLNNLFIVIDETNVINARIDNFTPRAVDKSFVQPEKLKKFLDEKINQVENDIDYRETNIICKLVYGDDVLTVEIEDLLVSNHNVIYQNDFDLVSE